MIILQCIFVLLPYLNTHTQRMVQHLKAATPAGALIEPFQNNKRTFSLCWETLQCSGSPPLETAGSVSLGDLMKSSPADVMKSAALFRNPPHPPPKNNLHVREDDGAKAQQSTPMKGSVGVTAAPDGSFSPGGRTERHKCAIKRG